MKDGEIGVSQTSKYGPPDGVEAFTECTVVEFVLDNNGEPTGLKDTPKLQKCKIMAACSNGTISLSVRDLGLMVTVRLEEMSALLQEAAATSRNFNNNIR